MSMLDISTVGQVSVSIRSALGTSRRELSEDISFGVDTSDTIGTLLVVDQSNVGKRPRGVSYTPSYTVLYK